MIIKILNNIGILIITYTIVLASTLYLLNNDINRYLVIIIGVMLGFIVSNTIRRLLDKEENKE